MSDRTKYREGKYMFILFIQMDRLPKECREFQKIPMEEKKSTNLQEKKEQLNFKLKMSLKKMKKKKERKIEYAELRLGHQIKFKNF